jgi:hypothetical protein
MGITGSYVGSPSDRERGKCGYIEEVKRVKRAVLKL